MVWGWIWKGIKRKTEKMKPTFSHLGNLYHSVKQETQEVYRAKRMIDD